MPNLAGHDPLTGLPNRPLLRDRLGQALAQGRRRNGLLALIQIELDGLTPGDDVPGAAVGDGTAERVLQEVASRLRSAVRASEPRSKPAGARR
jgi:diguanylate cyclase (GGDEF)-like protein